MIDPAYESMLERYRLAWEAGRYDQIIPAFRLCSAAGLALPAWLSEAALDDLQYAYKHRQRGGPSSRTGAIQDASNRMHGRRHALVKLALEQQAWELDHGLREKRPSKREAAKDAFAMLHPNTEASAREIEQILESYDSIEKRGEKF